MSILTNEERQTALDILGKLNHSLLNTATILGRIPDSATRPEDIAMVRKAALKIVEEHKQAVLLQSALLQEELEQRALNMNPGVKADVDALFERVSKH